MHTSQSSCRLAAGLTYPNNLERVLNVVESSLDEDLYHALRVVNLEDYLQRKPEIRKIKTTCSYILV